jgi:hypothetical protein
MRAGRLELPTALAHRLLSLTPSARALQTRAISRDQSAYGRLGPAQCYPICYPLAVGQRDPRLRSDQVEHERESVVYYRDLITRQMRDLIAERARVNRSDHLAQHPRRLVAEEDLGMEARRRRGGRGRADDHRGQGEQVVGLNDYSVAAAMLNAATPAREGDCADVTADHAAAP